MKRQNFITEYADISYIQSTGSQVIDTHWAPNYDDYEIYLDFMYTITPYHVSIIGQKCSQDNNWLGGGYFPNQNLCRMWIGSTSNVGGVTMYGGTRYVYGVHVIRSTNTWYQILNDTARTTGSYQGTPSTTYTYVIGGTLLNNQVYYGSSYRIYNCIIKANGIIVHNYIPKLRLYDNKPGLFDTITNTFSYK